jgi:putative MATE family efflux protein
MLLQSAYALVDLAFISRIGGKSVAALSISLQAFFIILAISQSIAAAALADVSQLYGAGKIQEARRAFTGYCLVGAGVGVAAAVMAYLTAPKYVSFFTHDQEVFRLGLGYFRISALTFFFQVQLIIFGHSVRASGDFNLPMKLMGLSVLVNLVLDPLLIFGIGPFPRLELDGAAWATVISQILTLCIYLTVLSRRSGERRLYWSNPEIGKALLLRILVRGVPAGMQFFLISVVTGLVLYGVKPHGATWTATAGAGFRVMQQMFLPMVALASAAAAITGQNFGAKQMGRVRKVALTALKGGIAYGCVVSLIMFFLGKELGLLFAKTDVDLESAKTYFQWSSPSTIAFAMTFVPSFVLQAAGRAVVSLSSAICRAALLAVGVLWLVPHLTLAPHWIFGLQSSTAWVEGILDVVLLFYFLRVWAKDSARPGDSAD